MICELEMSTPFLGGAALVWRCYGTGGVIGTVPAASACRVTVPCSSLENSALFLDSQLTFQQTPSISVCQQIPNVSWWRVKHVDVAGTSFVRAVCGSSHR